MQIEFLKFGEKLGKDFHWWKGDVGMEKLQEYLAISRYKILETSKWEQDVELSLRNNFSKICIVVSMQNSFFHVRYAPVLLVCLSQSILKYTFEKPVLNMHLIPLWIENLLYIGKLIRDHVQNSLSSQSQFTQGGIGGLPQHSPLLLTCNIYFSHLTTFSSLNIALSFISLCF